ncbi:phosphotransferase [Streptomyces palmae]|uniref:Aminoglycoside phosphotransferase n=1 Tax=Streptomyces palmae TaxID=1701085 RepID=A0A4Z0GKJ0_9ACTN|nr:phosphotransferase [Streptomyces palmae]TGA96089.1 aminoglycoside phosphotransferase [Streptomyces palmae]
MPRSLVLSAETDPDAPPDRETLYALHAHYDLPGEPLTCRPVSHGLLNRGYRLTTTHGGYFLKHHLDGDRAAIARQHRVTERLDVLGVPVAPPVADRCGETVTVIDGRCWALHPWVEGRHRDGGQLNRAQCWALGALLGLVHLCLEEVIDPRTPAPSADHTPDELGADPEQTFELIERLLSLARARQGRDAFDDLAVHRLEERRELLARHAHRRPEAAQVPATGWVHGDFHPLNLLYRDGEPAAIVDWDRLGVQPRAEEAVRAAAIFFVLPGGRLELAKVRPYARAYRCVTGATPEELAAAVHRVWWERLNDFWMLSWHYQLGDWRADPQFPAAAALAVWWTREYEAVRAAFAG